MKRTLSMVICLVFVLSILLTGCGGNTTQSSDNTTSAADKSTQTVGSNAGTQDEINLTGYPIVKNKITLKIVAKTNPIAPPYNEMALVKKFEEETNVHVEWDNIPENIFEEKKNLILASNDLPDAFWNMGANFSDYDIMNYGKLGTLIPYENMIDKYAPNLKNVFEKRPAMKAICTMPDGHMYTFPSGTEMGFVKDNEFFSIGDVPYFYSINKKWLDKLGLKVPTTLDELHDVLVAFRDKDPNGNGKKDEIPMSFMHMWWCADIGGLFGSFGLGDSHLHRDVKDGKIFYSFTQPEYKEAINYFHNWVKDGLIDQESFTQDDKAYLAKGANPDYVLGSYIWWETEQVVGNDRAGDYVKLPPLKGPNGQQTQLRHEHNIGDRRAFAITKVNKYPEITMRWVDYMYQPLVSAQIEWGPIGDVFKLENGKMIQNPCPAGTSVGDWKVKTAPQGPKFTFAEDFGTVVDMEPRAMERLEDIQNIYLPYMTKKECIVGPLIYTPEEIDTINKAEIQISKDISGRQQGYADEMRAKWLVKGGIDEEWDSYLAQLNKLGLEKMIAAQQAAYDRFQKVLGK